VLVGPQGVARRPPLAEEPEEQLFVWIVQDRGQPFPEGVRHELPISGLRTKPDDAMLLDGELVAEGVFRKEEQTLRQVAV